MADSEDDQCDPETLLLQRHKKERKELQAEVQKLKHSVTKGDKKKKKEVNEKIAILEAELEAKHEQEVADLKQQHTFQGLAVSSEVMNDVTAAVDHLSTEQQHEGTVHQKKTSKAQKRRDKKAAANLEREERLREQEIENLTSSRHLEAVKIKSLLTQRGLQIHEIPSDGDCLYAAVAHQLSLRKISSSTGDLRSQVAGYMRENPAEFIPFLTSDSGDSYTEGEYEKYCHDMETTPAWGGQLEIQALANTLKLPIEVVQFEGPSIHTGEQFSGNPLVLAYYRHAYGLGEHYQSVEEKLDNEDDELT